MRGEREREAPNKNRMGIVGGGGIRARTPALLAVLSLLFSSVFLQKSAHATNKQTNKKSYQV